MATNRLRKNKKYHWLVSIVLIISFILIIFAGAYFWHWTSAVPYSFLPLPIASLNGRYLTYAEFITKYRSLDHYYRELYSQKLLTQLPSKRQLLVSVYDQAMKDFWLRQFAEQHQIAVTPAELQTAANDFQQTLSKLELSEQQIKDYYRLSYRQFLSTIVRPLLLAKKVEAFLLRQPAYNQERQERAEKILAEAQKPGTDFTELAKKYSDDATAILGGDLGFFSRQDMPAEFSSVVFSLKIGEISPLIKTKYGFHIVKVEKKVSAPETKTDDSTAEQVRARQILIANRSFSDWLAGELKAAPIKRWLQF